MTDKNALDQLIESNQSASNKKHTNYLLIGLGVAVIFIAVFATTMSLNNNADLPIEEDVVLTAEAVEQLRQTFKSALVEADSQTVSITSDDDYRNWAPTFIEEFETQKEKALTVFANGNYQEALTILNSAQHDLLTRYSDFNEQFNGYIKEVEHAFNVQNYNKAQLELNKAFALKPSSSLAAEHQQDLNLQPILERLYNQLSVAQTENNLDKEIAVLKEILSTDPAQTDAQYLMNKAISEKQDIQFTSLISQGLKLVQQGDLKAADKKYLQARKIYPNRPELNLLSKRLSRSVDAMTLENIQQKLSQYKAKDLWSEAYFLALDATTLYPTDAPISETLEQAKSIINFSKEAASYLDRPKRLQDNNVQSHAKKLISTAKPFASLSPTLNDVLNELEIVILDASTLVTVTITSDRRTTVSILGYGSLGKFNKKTIQLPSGNFTLVGMRKGYAVNRTSFTVTKNNTPSLEMICNERI